MRPGSEAQPFYGAAEFEQAKQRAGGIAKWIEEQLAGTSVTVVLFGAETYSREWVKHEIKRSYELDKGILAIDIHRLKDPQHGADVQGLNPLVHWQVAQNGRNVASTSRYRTYDWVNDNGYANMPAWIEAGRRLPGGKAGHGVSVGLRGGARGSSCQGGRDCILNLRETQTSNLSARE